MRFINDDRKVKPNGRKAPRITIAELQEKMYKRAKALAPEAMNGDELEEELTCVEDMESGYGLALAIEAIHSTDATICKDNHFHIGCSEMNIPGECDYVDDGPFAPALCGWQTLPNGFTFFGYVTATGGLFDAFVIIYHDGKKLRMYTPVRGNKINMDYKCSFGDEYADDETKILDKYRKAGLDVDRYVNSQERFVLYAQMYEQNPWEMPYNWHAIREDIETHIAVI